MTAVTVVIPAYNAASTLEESLLSALGQTMTDFEVVLVDDGSTDQTHAIAQSYAARDGRIRILKQANRGVAGAPSLPSG